ncbi:MAG: hypothetical protein R3C51_10840 [Parvularculaceae bacterium]
MRYLTAGCFALLAAMSSAEAARWDNLKRESCVSPGKRQYSSRLLDAGWSWENDCKATSASLNGRNIGAPNRCDNHGPGGMWGVWFVSDGSCAANWGAPKEDACTAPGRRQISSVIHNIPPGQSWEDACAKTPLTYKGVNVGTPARCVHQGAGGMWGIWDVADSACGAHWDTPKRDKCAGPDKAIVSSIIRDVPSGQSWEDACAQTRLTYKGVDIGTPSRCDNHGIGGMWGVWSEAKDSECVSDDRSAEERTRAQYEADRPSIESKQASMARAFAAAEGIGEEPGLDQTDKIVAKSTDAGRRGLMKRRLDAEGVSVVTLMGGGFGAVVVGYGHAEGFAMKKGASRTAPGAGEWGAYTCKKVWSNTFTAGLALGGGGVMELGEWGGDFDTLAGDTNGVQGSLSLLAVSWGTGAHWNANGTPAGVTVSHGGGAGALDVGVEYVHGWTGVDEADVACDTISWK